MKQLNKKKVLEFLQKIKADNLEQYKITTIILDTIKTHFDGKPFSKRIATKTQTILQSAGYGSWTIRHDNIHGMHYLRIYNQNNQLYMSFLLGYASETVVNAGKTEERLGGYLLNEKRNKDIDSKMGCLSVALLIWNKLIRDVANIQEAFLDDEGMRIYPFSQIFNPQTLDECNFRDVAKEIDELYKTIL